LAREIREGTYRRGAPGRAYQAARTRQEEGIERRRVEIGDSGVYEMQRQFSSIAGACRWAVSNLPPRTNAYLVGYGKLIAQSGDPDEYGQMAWRALTDFVKAGQMLGIIPYAEAEVVRLFTNLRYVVLRWEE
jgi:hypothetical protein